MSNKMLLAVSSILAATSWAAQAAAEKTVIHSFNGANGSSPYAGLIQGTDGALYGTTASGGSSGNGTVFRLTPPATEGGAWVETILYSFTGTNGDGSDPTAPVIFGHTGELYGTTQMGGRAGVGTVFALKPPQTGGGSWEERVLYSFTGAGGDGVYPNSLIEGFQGELYGTTVYGGNGGLGTIFELEAPATGGEPWTETVLFSGTSSANFISNLVLGHRGELYGLSFYGGAYAGTFFSLMPPSTPTGSWEFKLLYSFGAFRYDAVYPINLIRSPRANFFGVSEPGGTENVGTVFELIAPESPGGVWTENVLHSFSFNTSDGAYPVGVANGPNGELFGLTANGGGGVCGENFGCGTVFSLVPPAAGESDWTETVLAKFTEAGGDGLFPNAPPLVNTDGTLYGTTMFGGEGNCPGYGCGTVFQVNPVFGAHSNRN
jgi:uncharacterized repeat protein (TIGR03803 family)